MASNGIPNNVRNLRPPINTYSPSLWGDIFTSFEFDSQVQESYAQEIEELKKDVRTMLVSATPSNSIVLVDTLERLGLAYHFEQEIDDKLGEIYKLHTSWEDRDLLLTALAFRILRQHQYHVSADVFDKFINNDNKFKEDLIDDVEGLLSLYEAAHVRIHGEPMLDEAVAFTTHHLTRVVEQLESPTKDKVKRALEQSLHHGVPIIEIRIYISAYEKDKERDNVLLKLAKLNFNFMQNEYKKELHEVSTWWNKFDLKTKLPFARDRLVECFLWGAAVHYEPKFSEVRIAIAKAMQMVSVMDDTYDNYGTLDEDQLLTDAFERWDVNDIDQLPEFMKIVYRFIMSIDEDFVRDATKHGKAFAIPYFRETVKQLGRAYNQEQIWLMEQRMPTFEEYMNNSVVTSCIYVMFLALVPGMESVTEQDIQWFLSEPKLVISTAKMGRHLEDLGSHERENRDGKMVTVVDCYMRQYGVSKEEALSRFEELVEDGWKKINTEWAKGSSGSVPKHFVEQLLNYGRIAEVTYKHSEDGYTNPEKFLAPQIAAVFIDPIPV